MVQETDALLVGSGDPLLLLPLDQERFPENSLANLEGLAAGIPVPTDAIDDQTAIPVVDGTIEVVSEGHWILFAPNTDKRLTRFARDF